MNIAEEVQSSVWQEEVGMIGLDNEIRLDWRFKDIVGKSAALRRVLQQIEVVAPTDATVLITGETGTGKERFARAVHEHSRRSSRAFVSVNCGALAPSLVSSELFGHERGAFTGAVQRRAGRFELAHSGTIFLDEIGELSADTQVALLRVLQEREFERVGGTQSVHVDVRIIAATNRDLRAEIANGTFRSDLYYRLNVFPIEVPPLRERKDDIKMLVEYFVKHYAKRTGKNVRFIDNRTLELLHFYDWPGNVRELQNIIERSVILTPGDVLSVDEGWFFKESRPLLAASSDPLADVSSCRMDKRNCTSPDTTSVSSSDQCEIGDFDAATPRTLRESERALILRALNATGWTVGGRKGAAVQLGLKRTTLLHRMKKHGLERPSYHPPFGEMRKISVPSEAIGV